MEFDSFEVIEDESVIFLKLDCVFYSKWHTGGGLSNVKFLYENKKTKAKDYW